VTPNGRKPKNFADNISFDWKLRGATKPLIQSEKDEIATPSPQNCKKG